MAKFKFNALDLIIIVIVAAILCAGALLFTKVNKDKAGKQTPVTVEFTIEVKELTKSSADAFEKSVGKRIVYGTKNSDYGVITKVETEPCKRMSKDTLNGKVIWDTYPERYTANVTIKADIYETETAFVGATEEVRVGQKMPFSGGGIASPEGVIVNVEKLEGGLK